MNRAIVTILLLFALSIPNHLPAANSSTNFGGIGIDGAPLDDGQIVIRQLVAGGPAHLAGLHTGDIITKIDGKPTKGSDFAKMVEYRLRGKAGTKVLLAVQRPSTGKSFNVTLVRRQLLAPKTEGKK